MPSDADIYQGHTIQPALSQRPDTLSTQEAQLYSNGGHYNKRGAAAACPGSKTRPLHHPFSLPGPSPHLLHHRATGSCLRACCGHLPNSQSPPLQASRRAGTRLALFRPASGHSEQAAHVPQTPKSHRPELSEHLAKEFTNHLLHHPTCYISLAFYLQLVRRHPTVVPAQRLHKMLSKVVSCLEESGEVSFLNDMERGTSSDWETARRSLEVQLLGRSPPRKPRQSQRSEVSHSKIPPLVLPAFKPIGSSRYSAMSRQERGKGLAGLRQLARAVGQGFIAVELGCLLAHKRTRQVQQLSDNSDYRSQCLQRAETERELIKGWWSESKGERGAVDRQMEETNQRYHRRVLLVLFNFISMGFDSTKPNYSPQALLPFYGQLLDLIEVGVVDPFSEAVPQPFLSSIDLKLKSLGKIVQEWSELVSFATEKRHLRMLANRGRSGCMFSYEQGPSERQVRGGGLMEQVKEVRAEHLVVKQGGANPATLQDRKQSDWVLLEIARRSCSLIALCDMASPRFYKYQANLLSAMAAYLNNSFSATTKYLCLDLFFPYLALVKRQIIQLSHPYSDFPSSSSHSSKPLFAQHPSLFCGLLRVLGALLCNQKHVEKLLSGVFLKCPAFMQTLQRYVGLLFDRDMREQILGVLDFYQRCLRTYSHRKMRNAQSRSMKILLSHLAGYLYPRVGCIWSRLEVAGVGQGGEDQGFIQKLVSFVKEVFEYCEEEVGESLLEQEIACHYVRYSFLNFVKLYSSLTVAELGVLAGDQTQPATKQSPHFRPQYHRTPLMLHFLGILTNLSLHRNPAIAKTLKQYRVLEFMARQYELEFQLKENIEKYIKKVAKPREVPKSKKQSPKKKNRSESKEGKIPSLNLKAQSFKIKTVPEQPLPKEKPNKKGVPSLKLPTRTDRSEPPGLALDGLLDKINKNSMDEEAESGMDRVSSERGLIYDSERRVRKIYSNGELQGAGILLVLSLLLKNGQLDPDYCDQFPVSHGKTNFLYLLHHHLNHPANSSLLPLLAQGVQRIKPFLAGQRLLKLLAAPFTDLSHYTDWRKIGGGAYGVIYACQTQLHDPSQVAIKQLPLPRSVYERCVLHDIFSEISCLESLRLDDKVTTMYNYGVSNSAYVIIMRKYDCSLRDWVRKKVRQEDGLVDALPIVLRVFREVLEIVLLLHEQSVTHYDLKADNLLLLLSEDGNPSHVAVGDFGECRLFSHPHPQLDMKSRGTECIKSPQMLTLALQLKKQSDNYDRRKKVGTTRASDIWSLGCLFYEVVTGQFLFHRPDWVNFYVQVTNSSEELLNQECLSRLDDYPKRQAIIDFLRCCLVRDPHHRPEIRAVIQKYKELFGEGKQPQRKPEQGVEGQLGELVSQYLGEVQDIKSSESILEESVERFDSRSNRFMRIMEDIWFVEGLQGEQGVSKARKLGITHVVITRNHHLLGKFNVLKVEGDSVGAAMAICELLRQVLLLKGKLLVVNDPNSRAASLLVYCLSYWFRCSLYETWCLINTQSLLFPALTLHMRDLARPLRTLSLVQSKVQLLPKLQCICGSVTLILKQLPARQKGDFSCKCKRKQVHQWAHKINSSSDCPSTGCQTYLELVKKRYSIAWECVRWARISHEALLTPVHHKRTDALKLGKQGIARTQVLLNGHEPSVNMVDIGSCLAGWRVMACRVCDMMMCACGDEGQLMVVMNNMLRRVRQGIMVPNAQERYAKRTPALANYTLTKLHLTQPAQHQ